MPQQAHIAYRVNAQTLIENPEIVLQRMSFKILEKREQVLEGLIGTKVQFKSNNNKVEQGTCQSVSNQHCNVKVGTETVKVNLKKMIL